MKRQTASGKSLVFLCLLSAPSLCAQLGGTAFQARARALAAMESRLFDLANGERQAHGLLPLRLAPDLTDMARRHSADMARSRRLSHESSGGASYEDRLVEAGFFFSAGGENVARSRPDAPDEIHAHFMASPEHRVNVLNPGYDTIGVGAAVGDDGAFFVTQDFLKPVEVLDRGEAKRRAVLKTRIIRASRAVPPLVWDREVDAIAEKLARARAAGRDLPVIPDSLGEASALFVVAPSLDDLEAHAGEIARPDCREGGLGVTFGRDGAHRGGAYFLVLLLLPANRYLELSEGERHEIVRAVFNEYRSRRGVRELVWRDGLARDADSLVKASVPTRRQRLRGAALGRPKAYLSYQTIDLRRTPAGTEASVLDPVLSGIGVRTVFEKTREFPRGAFRVIVVMQ